MARKENKMEENQEKRKKEKEQKELDKKILCLRVKELNSKLEPKKWGRRSSSYHMERNNNR